MISIPKQGASDKEKEALSRLTEKVSISELEEIEEGNETDDFWEMLGGQDEYFTLPRTQVRFIQTRHTTILPTKPCKEPQRLFI